MPICVTIFSRHDCYPCTVVCQTALHLQSELPIKVRKVYIDNDTDLMERYGMRVPVVLVEEVEYFAGKVVTEQELRRAIKKARWRRPISRILSRLGFWPKQG
jgi:hypothetical protein